MVKNSINLNFNVLFFNLNWSMALLPDNTILRDTENKFEHQNCQVNTIWYGKFS